ncbi:MAG: hypothetical protein PHN69_03230 [Candidatus Pacebacteria bacterium]|nr:hypothetical protein [Candidatus Paceibacterota bacterium]
MIIQIIILGFIAYKLWDISETLIEITDRIDKIGMGSGVKQ